MIGYRIMAYNPTTRRAVSGADSRVTVPLKTGEVHNVRGLGMFLTPHRQHAIDYYAVHDLNAILEYEFNADEITSGNLSDAEPEISVQCARLVSVTILDEDLEIVVQVSTGKEK